MKFAKRCPAQASAL